MDRSPHHTDPRRPLEADRRRDLALSRRIAPALPVFGQTEARR